VRPGVNIELNRSVTFGATYAYFNTAGASEHRTHEQVVWGQRVGGTAVRNRFRAEQRWFGTEHPGSFQHRLRHMLRVEVPLKRTAGEDPAVYAAPFNEVMARFSQGQAGNFDQNRTGAMLGWRLSRWMTVEAGGFHQWFRRASSGAIENNNVFVLVLNSRAPLGKVFSAQP
jgi:hypothetical protein